MAYPVIDIFAGPGGLGEGFTQAGFDIRLSIEKDANAHKTLLFRSFARKVMRSINGIDDLRDYYLGKVDELFLKEKYALEYDVASNEAWLAELGITPHEEVRARIAKELDGHKNWVLIGGPPCQAYSLVGRARMQGSDPTFEDDHRHFLYKEYLRIVAEHEPTIFVMENVKGILSANVKKIAIFEQILSDLSSPMKAMGNSSSQGVEYDLHPICEAAESTTDGVHRFLVKSENYGIPQKRHRVFIIGVKKGSGIEMRQLERVLTSQVSVKNAIKDLPPLRAGLTNRIKGSSWSEVASMSDSSWFKQCNNEKPLLAREMSRMLGKLKNKKQNNGANVKERRKNAPIQNLHEWYLRNDIDLILNHECRNHMSTDLQRYFYAACYAKVYCVSPKLRDYPEALLPNHKNVSKNGDKTIFDDRFRVQCWESPSTTIVSHISKDGHYYIHPDASQCRSLTVREAARLQTFPDNYFFQGSRTAQFHQVGNAVPPYLAYQIAGKVKEMLNTKKIPDLAIDT